MFPEKAKEYKRDLLNYIEMLHKQFVGPCTPTNNTGNTGTPGTLEIHSSGYPVAPRTGTWKKVTRNDLEPIYRMYITEHYRKCFDLISTTYNN